LKLIQIIGKKLRYNQIVIASGTSFYKRFYLKNSLVEYDPKLVAMTCLYLAVKVEEMGQLRPDHILAACKQLDTIGERNLPSKFRPSDVYTCEVSLLEQLQFDLVVFHPYYDLERIVRNVTSDPKVLANAWIFLNESQQTDCSLTYPPIIIAFASLYLASVQSGLDIKSWFEELNLNLDQVRNCALEMTDPGVRYSEQEHSVAMKDLAQLWGSKQGSTI
jgi:cyclin C